MNKQIKKWLREVDIQENDIIRVLIESNNRFANEVSDMIAGSHVVRMNQEYLRKIRKSAQLLKQWYGKNSKIYRGFIKKIYKIGWKQAGENLLIVATFSSMPDITPLIKGGLVFMQNYTEDLIQIAQKRIALGMLAGDTYEEVADDLRKIIPHTAKRRIDTMVRDQSSRVYQESTKTFYVKHKNLIKEYKWIGPMDQRTTTICRDREDANPYTFEDMQNLDPHPHINCRHRWVAVIKEV